VPGTGTLVLYMEDPWPVSPKGLVVNRSANAVTDAGVLCAYNAVSRSFCLQDINSEKRFLNLVTNSPNRVWSNGVLQAVVSFSCTFLNAPDVVRKYKLEPRDEYGEEFMVFRVS
jgi:hypothetical protein